MRIAHEVIAGTARTLQGRRERVDAVAAKTGIHRNTVRRRLARMERVGFMFPLRGLVNPPPLGGLFARAFFPVPFERQTPRLEQELFDGIDGLWCVLRLDHGWDLMVAGAEAAEVERAYAKAAKVLKSSPDPWFIRTDRDWDPAPRVSLDSVDREIVHAVVDRGLGSFGSLARTLGVSKRTVERRYANLSGAGAIRLWPMGGAPLAGLSMLYLHLELDPESARSRRARDALLRLPNQFLLDVRRHKAWSYLFSASATSLLRTAAEISQMPFVRGSFAQFYHGMTTNPRFSDLNRRLLRRLG